MDERNVAEDLDLLPDRVQQALEAFWRGSSEEFDLLLGDADGKSCKVCEMLKRVIRDCGRRPGS